MNAQLVSHSQKRVDQKQMDHSSKGSKRAGLSFQHTHPAFTLQSTIGNQALQRLVQSRGLQPKLTISQPTDEYEREADRIADQVMRMPDPSIQRACSPCAAGGPPCPTCRHKDDPATERKTNVLSEQSVPDNFLRNLGAGQPLDPTTKAFFENRLGYDFGEVRVHSDAHAASSADSLSAQAFTIGRNIVFGAGRYAPSTSTGKRLLAHELTHVLQQGVAIKRKTRTASPLWVGIQRQFITPHGQGGGFGGLMERDRRAAAEARSSAAPSTVASPYQVCARDLQGVLGYIGNHAYIDAPPFRYAVISPLCPANWWDNPVTGTTAQKWDNSPDPCGKTPACVPCHPAPGVTNVEICLRDAFNAYQSLSLYRGTGPNSNTFAGTLARTCCAGMVPKPRVLGNVPGWNDPPAPARAGGTPCPPGPTC